MTQLFQSEPSLFDDVKKQFTEQARINREEFENMDEAFRAQYEGFRFVSSPRRISSVNNYA